MRCPKCMVWTSGKLQSKSIEIDKIICRRCAIKEGKSAIIKFVGEING